MIADRVCGYAWHQSRSEWTQLHPKLNWSWFGNWRYKPASCCDGIGRILPFRRDWLVDSTNQLRTPGTELTWNRRSVLCLEVGQCSPSQGKITISVWWKLDHRWVTWNQYGWNASWRAGRYPSSRPCQHAINVGPRDIHISWVYLLTSLLCTPDTVRISGEVHCRTRGETLYCNAGKASQCPELCSAHPTILTEPRMRYGGSAPKRLPNGCH